MSNVACVRADSDSTDPRRVFAAVDKAMRLAKWGKYVKGKNLVLKVNVVWDKIYPSCTTTPMVIEGVIRTIKAAKKYRPKKITVVDTDTAAIVRADISFRIQGIEKMAQKYGIEVINLSHTDFTNVGYPKGLVLKHLKISRVLLEADTIITMPVLKTHSYSQMTGALKNQWGCIHDLRHNFHTVLNPAIVDVNNFFRRKITFAVMDGLFGMEGQGPKTGNPRKVGYILASHDKVALDTAAARMMGLEPKTIKHLILAERAGLGTMKATIVGDKLPEYKFKPASSSNIVMGTEMRLRHLGKWAEWMMFNGKSPFLFLFRWTAKIYYDIWYELVGKKKAEAMLGTNYGLMWKKYLT